jgi:hypothetical protein
MAYETEICHSPHNSSNWDSHITGQLGYKHTFCENVVSTKKTAYTYKNGKGKVTPLQAQCGPEGG